MGKKKKLKKEIECDWNEGVRRIISEEVEGEEDEGEVEEEGKNEEKKEEEVEVEEEEEESYQRLATLSEETVFLFRRTFARKYQKRRKGRGEGGREEKIEE